MHTYTLTHCNTYASTASHARANARAHTHKHLHTYLHAHARANAHAHTHKHLHTYLHAHARANARTHTQRRMLARALAHPQYTQKKSHLTLSMQTTAGLSSGATGGGEWLINADDGLKTRVLVALGRDAVRGAGGIWELGEPLRHGLARVLFDTQSYSRAQGFRSLLLLLADTSVFMPGCGAAAISALFLRKV